MSWPHVPPMFVLILALAVTLAAMVAGALLRRGKRAELLALARQWGMHYTPRDTFNLSSRVAPHLPVPGAADVLVCDLIYGTEAAGHRYIFCAEFTVGIIRAKKRRRCVCSVVEPRDHSDAAMWTGLRIAPTELPILEQYRNLHDEAAGPAISLV